MRTPTPWDGIPFYETDERVKVDAALETRLRWRAERRARNLNAQRDRMGLPPSYRYDVVHERGRYRVLAFQNVARKP